MCNLYRQPLGTHAPQHFLYFLPLPHGHGSFLPILGFVLLSLFLKLLRHGLSAP
jgi:hypothetical protein